MNIGKKAAEKSGGLFSADDWMCKSCETWFCFTILLKTKDIYKINKTMLLKNNNLSQYDS